jgi:UDPglucose 6-dehydrogenase
MKQIAVVGLGYVGLTTAVGLAQLGHQVLGFDVDDAKVSRLGAGESPIYENGLEAALKLLIQSKNLAFTNSLDVVKESGPEFIFVCVATPQDVSGAADLTILNSVCSQLAGITLANSILVIKSTVPVGTGQSIANTLKRSDVFVASNPEFLREGTAMKDFMEPDRIVVGANRQEAAKRVLDLYTAIDSPKLETNLESAELIKYAANAYLAVRLSFTNDIAALSEKANANVDQVLNGMGLDKRIGTAFLKPGPGWGGSCFPKDTNALVAIANGYGSKLPLVESAIASNRAALKRSVAAIAELVGGDVRDKIVGVWGIAFKANTDDIRDSPALMIIESLLSMGAKVQAYDPVAVAPERAGFVMKGTALEAAAGADVLAVLTEWPEFAEVFPEKVTEAMRTSVVYDARRILPKSWKGRVSVLKVLGEASE